eukprot:g77865.t1
MPLECPRQYITESPPKGWSNKVVKFSSSKSASVLRRGWKKAVIQVANDSDIKVKKSANFDPVNQKKAFESSG